MIRADTPYLLALLQVFNQVLYRFEADFSLGFRDVPEVIQEFSVLFEDAFSIGHFGSHAVVFDLSHVCLLLHRIHESVAHTWGNREDVFFRGYFRAVISK